MNVFVKDRDFYKRVIAITIPIALQNLILFGVSLADTIMVGMLGEVQLSAVSIANQPGFIATLMSFGMGSGACVMAAQYWGKGDVGSIQKIMTIMFRAIIAASLVFTAFAVFLPRPVVMIFTTDPAVIDEAAKFLRIVGLSYLPMMTVITTIGMLRSVSAVKIALVVYISSLLTNTFLNWLLIFGKLGAPALGVTGAAIATCAARCVELLITLVYIFKIDKKIKYRFKMLFMRETRLLRQFIETGVPVVLNELLWGSGTAVIAVIIGRMGREFTAANAICSVLSQLITVVMFGISSAASVIIGNTIGGGDYKKAGEYSKTFIAISFLLGLCGCIMVLILKNPMLSFYNISPLARAYADQIISIYAFVCIFVSMASVILIGVLRGGGDTRFVLVVDIIFMWVLCIPAGFIGGLFFNWPVWLVYSVIKCDEVLKVIFSLARVKSDKWIIDVTAK